MCNRFMRKNGIKSHSNDMNFAKVHMENEAYLNVIVVGNLNNVICLIFVCSLI